MKNPLTPAGIEPATFRFVAQHLNHCATAVPYYCNNYLKLQVIQVLLSVQLEYVFVHKTDIGTHLAQKSTISVLATCFGGYIAMIRVCNTPGYLKHFKILV